MNSDFPPTANAQPSKKAYSLYLWPRSKCWIRASRASIQHAATKVTNIDSFISRWMCFGWRGKIRIRVVGLNYTGDVGASVYFSNLTNQTFRARIYLKELDKAVCKISKLLYNK